jgi:hypothetical protein
MFFFATLVLFLHEISQWNYCEILLFSSYMLYARPIVIAVLTYWSIVFLKFFTVINIWHKFYKIQAASLNRKSLQLSPKTCCVFAVTNLSSAKCVTWVARAVGEGGWQVETYTIDPFRYRILSSSFFSLFSCGNQKLSGRKNWGGDRSGVNIHPNSRSDTLSYHI